MDNINCCNISKSMWLKTHTFLVVKNLNLLFPIKKLNNKLKTIVTFLVIQTNLIYNCKKICSKN